MIHATRSARRNYPGVLRYIEAHPDPTRVREFLDDVSYPKPGMVVVVDVPDGDPKGVARYRLRDFLADPRCFPVSVT